MTLIVCVIQYQYYLCNLSQSLVNVNGLKRIREFDKVTNTKERKILCLAVVNSLSMNFEINSHKYFEAQLYDVTANEHLVACPQLSKMFFQQTTYSSSVHTTFQRVHYTIANYLRFGSIDLRHS